MTAHVIINDQWNRTARLFEIQVTVIYNRAILSLWRQSAGKEGYLVKIDRDIGKQCIPISDAAERGVWSWSALFA